MTRVIAGSDKNPLAAMPRAQLLLLFVGSIWLVSAVSLLLSANLVLGVRPRTLAGLLGIGTSPWFHASWGHLISNTLPLLVLGWLTMLPRPSDFWQAVIGAMLGAGLTAWLLGGANSVHIGASGVVFGLFSYVLARGMYSRRLIDLAVALPAAVLYGGSMLLGLLPLYPGVSWQSHVGGALGGVLAAKLLKGGDAKP